MAQEKTVPVYSVKLLGSKSAEFDLPIALHKLDGNEVRFSMRVKALKKLEWAALRDDRQRAILAAFKPDEVVDKTDKAPIDTAIDLVERRGFVAKAAESSKRDAALIMQFAVSWPANEPLNTETLEALENEEVPGALESIIYAYDNALFHGRLGN